MIMPCRAPFLLTCMSGGSGKKDHVYGAFKFCISFLLLSWEHCRGCSGNWGAELFVFCGTGQEHEVTFVSGVTVSGMILSYSEGKKGGGVLVWFFPLKSPKLC